ncbi:uncharacterized protein LOC133779636 [Humulus lupulus]|uniref:uncharacterized protein LOC133779636 n=1 Tax=Humulus lupulus TaxID=3486 RepID=UPI002B408A74|nr:uncharacterized protein LOC133779636 [Humulus lupulus]
MDIAGKYLDSVDKWESFYEIYEKWMGFGKRSDDVKRRNRVVSMRRWVCTREGYRRSEYVNMPNRKKRSRPITRSGCQVALRVVHMKDNDLWLAKEFSHEHNHEMVSVPELQFLKNNRVVSDGLLAQDRSVNSVGIKTSQIVSHIAMQSGGYERMKTREVKVACLIQRRSILGMIMMIMCNAQPIGRNVILYCTGYYL